MGNTRKFPSQPASPAAQQLAAVAEPDPRMTEVGGQEGRVGPGAATPDRRMVAVSELDGDSARLREQASDAIDRRYVELGSALCPLGLSLNNGLERQPDGGYRVNFRGGHLNWTPDTQDVAGLVTSVATVTYKGLKCFGRQGGVGADQPYVVVSIIQPDPFVAKQQIPVASTRVPEEGTYEGVEDGDVNVGGVRKFWADAPQDLVIHTTVMEHDSGDPEKVRAAVEKALRDGVDAAAAAASGGTATSVPMDGDSLQGMAVKWLADTAASVLGAGDDNLGTGSLLIKAEDWMTGNLAPLTTEGPISYNYSQYVTDGDASYGAYYEVEMFQISRSI